MVTVTDLIHGPFVVVITDPEGPKDPDYPMVVCPEGGYKTKEEAMKFVERFASRRTPYLGLHFHVAQRGSEQSFLSFCSWED